MATSRWIVIAGCLVALAIWQCTVAVAQDSTAAAGQADPAVDGAAANPALQEARAAKIDANNAWVLTCSALVLLMTAPGLAMFYGGLVRRKNVLGVIMQCVFLMGLNSVVWCLWGYSFAFGGSDPWMGDEQYLLMRGVTPTWNETLGRPHVPMYSLSGQDILPLTTHMLFQGMFFIITPALICGAFAERMKFSTMAVFMLLWGTLVYCPLCHWVWDGGILAFTPTGTQSVSLAGGALDFAGGTVVHISSGVSALMCALLIGRRLGYPSEPMPPHNLTYTAIGTALLWFGWFGFNAGSQLQSDGIAASAFAATHFAAAAGTLAWAFMEWILRGKPTLLGACSGAVAGLVCITPASGYVTPIAALVLGASAGVVCYLACTKLKSTFGYDDSLDTFGVHGVGGTLGAILTGVFATRAVNNADAGQPLGLIEGGTRLIGGQCVAVLVTWVFAAVVTLILLKLLDATLGLRVTTQQELQGLDLTQHGEEGYIFM